MSCRQKITGLLLVAIATLFALGYVHASTPTFQYNPDRAKLLGYMLKESLPRNHYSHKKIDDGLSEAAFDLYIKSLDSQKRFLLKPDTVILNPYRKLIDNELKSGQIRFPLVTTEIIADRLEATEKMIEELLGKDFDFNRNESFETDPDKLDFASTEIELKNRWRKLLTYRL